MLSEKANHMKIGAGYFSKKRYLQKNKKNTHTHFNTFYASIGILNI